MDVEVWTWRCHADLRGTIRKTRRRIRKQGKESVSIGKRRTRGGGWGYDEKGWVSKKSSRVRPIKNTGSKGGVVRVPVGRISRPIWMAYGLLHALWSHAIRMLLLHRRIAGDCVAATAEERGVPGEWRCTSSPRGHTLPCPCFTLVLSTSN